MASLNMEEPFDLDSKVIDAEVTQTSAGNYALGRVDDKRKFLVSYIGRADPDVNGRLKSWASKSDHPSFKYSYATSAKTAFEKECYNYHDFSPPGNKMPPDSPSGITRSCPVCED